jgi:purine-binding chemotaxis protein CheW
MSADEHAKPLPHSDHLVIFTLESQRYALRLSAVERVVRMVEITPVPKAPGIVHGVVNVQGQLIAVLNLRARFHLPERDTDPSDQLVIAHTARRPVALAVDAVLGIVECATAAVAAAEMFLPGLAYVQGVVQLADSIVFIHDLDTFLSLQEERALDETVSSSQEAADAP